MKRGDIVTVAMQGDYGKPRPAVVIQNNWLNETHASVALLPFSSHIIDAPLIRITIEPDETNGLNKTSQIMVDKLMTPRVSKVNETIGKLNSSKMLEVNKLLVVFFGLSQ